jgi:hypothetical protein
MSDVDHQVWATRGSWRLPAVALVLCSICGCAAFAGEVGGEASARPPIEFIISYVPNYPSNPVGGIVVVRPPPLRMLIGTAPGARVELRLPYETPQVLNSMNFGPKMPPDHRYAFRVPSTFTPGRFACGPGQPLTEVTVTDVSGATLSRSFPLCPGIPVNPELAIRG